jgi:hypothetical protein
LPGYDKQSPWLVHLLLLLLPVLLMMLSSIP